MGKKKDRKKTVYISTGRDTRVRQCPACLAKIDAFTAMSMERTPGKRPYPKDKPPTPHVGSTTFCAYCGTLLVFTRKNFRIATAGEYEQIPEELRAVMQEWEKFRQQRRQQPAGGLPFPLRKPS